MAVRIVMKMKNDQSLTRSARAPDTMEAAVATNTIWKNQSDIVEYPFSMTAAFAASTTDGSASSGSSSRASSSADGP